MATSKVIKKFFDTDGFSPLTGARIWIVPQANSYPTGAVELVEDGLKPGQYAADNVGDGEYKVYIDAAGGTSPSLYESEVYVAEARLSLVADNFDSADSYRLKTTGIKDDAVTTAKLADQVKTLSALTDAYDYLGQIGVYLGKTYVASNASGEKWLPVKSLGYPYKDNALGDAVALRTMRAFIKELYITGTRDTGKTYAIAQVYRNSSTVWYIGIYTQTGTPGTVQEVARFRATSSPEGSGGITVHALEARNSSGLGGYIAVDWSALTAGTTYDNMWAHSNLYPLVEEIWDKKYATMIRADVNETAITALGVTASDLQTQLNSKIGAESDGKIYAGYPVSVQYQHSRGATEEAGNGTYGSLAYLGAYLQVSRTIVFDRLYYKIWGSANAVVEARIYKSSVYGRNPASLTLLHSVSYTAGQLNQTANGYHTIVLDTPVKVNANEYVYVFFYRSAGTSMTMARWTTLYGGSPERLPFLYNTTNPWASTWYEGDAAYYSVPFRLELSKVLDVAVTDALDTRLDAIEADYSLKVDPRITLPSKVYAVVGTEVNIQYDAIVLGTDCGKSSPKEMSVEVICTKGLAKERQWAFTPVSGDVGTHTLTVNVYDSNHVLLETKAVSLIVVASTAPAASGKNILMIGDSLIAAGTITTTVRDKFVALGSNVPTFRGFAGTSPANHQGIGGWRFQDYAGAGPSYFRFNVTGVTTVAYGDIYSNNGSQFTIREVNITGGTGYIKGDRSSGTNNPNTSGTLTKVSGSGDSSVSYGSYAAEAGNPLWNVSGAELDIENYRANLGMGAAVFDVVTLQLGINESFGALMDDTNRTAVVNYCKAILAALLADNASCKIIVVLPSTDGNTRGGWGANYGATGYKDYYQKNIIRLRELLISNLDASAYSANVEVSAAAMACDRYYGYARTSQAVASRISTTDEVHTNAVHPDTVGYQQMGDALYAQVLHKLQ